MKRKVYSTHAMLSQGMAIVMPGFLSIVLVATPACYGEMSEPSMNTWSPEKSFTPRNTDDAVGLLGDTIPGEGMMGLQPPEPDRWITVGFQEKPDSSQKTAPEEGISPRAVGPDSSSMPQFGALGSNDDPNYAVPIALDAVYSDAIEHEGDSNWYYVNVTTGGKLTVLMQTIQRADIDYDLHLYKLNLDTYVLEEAVHSQYFPKRDEQVSKIVAPGYYYIHIDSYTGYDPDEPYLFTAFVTENHDTAEPDDNIWQAPQRTGSFNTTQSIDNTYDLDWIYYPLTHDALLTMELGDVPEPLQYKVDIYKQHTDSTTCTGGYTLCAVANLSQNTKTNVELSEGLYFFRISSESGFNPDHSYTLNVEQASGIPDYVSLTSIDTDPGASPSGPLDYGQGDYYRVQYWLRAHGEVRDSNANPVANAPVSIHFFNPDASSPQTVWGNGRTDANGNYDVYIDIPHAYGTHIYPTYVSYHHYDIASFDIFSGSSDPINTNLYHFAYSIYRPH